MQLEYVEHMGKTDVRLFVVTVYQRQTHYHGDIEILTPVKGSVNIELSHRRYVVRVGDFFIINRNEPHSLLCTDEENMLLVLQFNPAFAKEYYPQMMYMHILQQHIVQEWMPRLHAELCRGFGDMLHSLSSGTRRRGYQMELIGSLNYLAAAIVQNGIWEDRSAQRSDADARVRARLSAVIDYIQENYMHSISLAQLAEMQKLDSTYLSHLIKDQLGIGFREYVNRLRLERAVYLLTHTQLRITDVCEECGYSDYRYLNKAIYNEFHLTPSQIAAGARPELSAFGYRNQPDDSPADEQDFLDLASVYDDVLKSLQRKVPENDAPPL